MSLCLGTEGKTSHNCTSWGASNLSPQIRLAKMVEFAILEVQNNWLRWSLSGSLVTSQRQGELCLVLMAVHLSSSSAKRMGTNLYRVCRTGNLTIFFLSRTVGVAER